MKPENRFSPIPIETGVLLLIPTYAWFFMLLRKAPHVALIFPIVYVSVLGVFIMLNYLASKSERKYFFSRVVALVTVMSPIIICYCFKMP